MKPDSGVCSLVSRAASEPSATATPAAATSCAAQRRTGANSATARTVDAAKFRTNSVPIVGMTEYCWRWTMPAPSSAAAPRYRKTRLLTVDLRAVGVQDVPLGAELVEPL